MLDPPIMRSAGLPRIELSMKNKNDDDFILRLMSMCLFYLFIHYRKHRLRRPGSELRSYAFRRILTNLIRELTFIVTFEITNQINFLLYLYKQ